MKFENNWRQKTLDLLEKRNTPDVPPDASNSLVNRCYRLRKKNLVDFTVENLRVMIGQNIGLDYLIPLAIERLENDILVEGDFFEGDLLKVVLNSEMDYWISEKDNWKRMCHIFKSNKDALESFDTTKSIKSAWFASFEVFEQIH